MPDAHAENGSYPALEELAEWLRFHEQRRLERWLAMMRERAQAGSEYAMRFFAENPDLR